MRICFGVVFSHFGRSVRVRFSVWKRVLTVSGICELDEGQVLPAQLFKVELVCSIC